MAQENLDTLLGNFLTDEQRLISREESYARDKAAFAAAQAELAQEHDTYVLEPRRAILRNLLEAVVPYSMASFEVGGDTRRATAVWNLRGTRTVRSQVVGLQTEVTLTSALSQEAAEIATAVTWLQRPTATYPSGRDSPTQLLGVEAQDQGKRTQTIPPKLLRHSVRQLLESNMTDLANLRNLKVHMGATLGDRLPRELCSIRKTSNWIDPEDAQKFRLVAAQKKVYDELSSVPDAAADDPEKAELIYQPGGVFSQRHRIREVLREFQGTEWLPGEDCKRLGQVLEMIKQAGTIAIIGQETNWLYGRGETTAIHA